MQPDHIIKIENLAIKGHKTFELNINDFQLKKGDTVSIIGANGSGKSTFIEGILDLRQRNQGEVTLLGTKWPCADNRFSVRMNLGVQLQSIAYPENYRVRELVQLHKALYPQTSELVYSAFAIKELISLIYGNLSKGQKQRVDLFMAMAHFPALLILDEPSSGLDKSFQAALVNMLRRRKEDDQLTTLMCSHADMEVELCDRIVCMQNGKIQQDLSGDVVQLNKAQFGDNKLTLKRTERWLSDQSKETLMARKVVKHVIEDDDDQVLLFGDEDLFEEGVYCISEGLGSGMDMQKTSTSDVLRILIGQQQANTPISAQY